MSERCPTCGALVRVNSSGEGTHWYEPITLPPNMALLRTPDGIPPGWYVTVEDNVPILHRRPQGWRDLVEAGRPLAGEETIERVTTFLEQGEEADE